MMWRFFDKTFDFVLKWILVLPLTLTQKYSRPIRISGFLVYFIWVVPITIICLIPIFICMMGFFLRKS